VVFNKALDEVFSGPLRALEGEAGIKRRTVSNMGVYGRLGAWRNNDSVLEYRTASGIWLANPKLSKHVLTLARDVAESYKSEVNKNQKAFATAPRAASKEAWDKYDFLRRNGLTGEYKRLIAILEDGDSFGKRELTNWYKRMKKTEFYKEGGPIDFLYEAARLGLEGEFGTSHDIREAWSKE
jgi:hypothetical protein